MKFDAFFNSKSGCTFVKEVHASILWPTNIKEQDIVKSEVHAIDHTVLLHILPAISYSINSSIKGHIL